MFDFIDFAALEKEVGGKFYEKGQLVTFTIKDVKAFSDKGYFTVFCEDQDGLAGKITFSMTTPNKKKSMLAFMQAFFTRDELVNKTYNVLSLIGQRFEVKSDAPFEKDGKKYQMWEGSSYRKVEALAAAEEFMV